MQFFLVLFWLWILQPILPQEIDVNGDGNMILSLTTSIEGNLVYFTYHHEIDDPVKTVLHWCRSHEVIDYHCGRLLWKALVEKFPGVVNITSHDERNVSTRAMHYPHVGGDIQSFLSVVEKLFPNDSSDKFGNKLFLDEGDNRFLSTHSYEIMYGQFLYPLIDRMTQQGLTVRLFEIGLGCEVPPKSAALWKQLMSTSTHGENNIYIAENDPHCIERVIEGKYNEGFTLLTGDQENVTTLYGWIEQTGGNFDVIIDDGGHHNQQIMTSFDVLFEHALAPGGLYFLEDLQVGREYPYQRYDEEDAMSDVIQAWIEQLLIRPKPPTSPPTPSHRYPLPDAVKWIFCQFEACVIAKCERSGPQYCRPW